MSRPHKLSPSLEEVAERLFGLPDNMLFRLANEDGFLQELPAATRRTIEQSPLLRARIERFRLAHPPKPGADGDADMAPTVLESIEVPRDMEARFARRVKALQGSFGKKGVSGQIVEVTNLALPESSSAKERDAETALFRPQYVLLDLEYSNADGRITPGVWRGWVMGEDPAYMSWSDVALQELDQPYEPVCTHVQAWNRILVRLENTGRVVGRLTMARLQAIREVWSEYASGREPLSAGAAPEVVTRTLPGGIAVSCGAPICEANDPRLAYRQMYFKLGELIKSPALAAIQAATSPSSATAFRLFVEGLADFAPTVAGAFAASKDIKLQKQNRELRFQLENSAAVLTVSQVLFKGKARVELLSNDAMVLAEASHLVWLGERIDVRRTAGRVFLELTPLELKNFCTQASKLEGEERMPWLYCTTTG